MKPALLALIFSLFMTHAAGQSGRWQQEIHYGLRVTLDDQSHTLDGNLNLTYHNNAPDTLHEIWFHLWPNAYKNDQTAFSEQMLQNGDTRFYFSDAEDRGYINGLDFRADGISLKTQDHPSDIDILKVLLPQALAPGDSINITTPFHVKLPFNFSRGGHHGQQYVITQWYPKPAVYDQQGWHTMPYLDQGEYYAEFGTYDVKITVPKGYVVAATGKTEVSQQSAVSSQQAMGKGQQGSKGQKSLSSIRTTNNAQRTTNNAQRTTNNAQRTTSNAQRTTKTLSYTQSNVHDFAWFADKEFQILHDTIFLPSGRVVDAFVYYHPAAERLWSGAMAWVKDAIRLHSEWIGEYPYPVVSVVEGVQGNPSGMEYPTITFIHDMPDRESVRTTIFHEVGHNWFQGALGNDERRFPWLDEGINTYYDERYLSMAPVRLERGRVFMDKWRHDLDLINYQVREAARLDQPIATSADSMHMLNYGAITYTKTAAWVKGIEHQMGRPAFDSAMHQYFNNWKFHHPYPEDLQHALTTSQGGVSSSAFDALRRTGPLDTPLHKPWRTYIPWTMRGTDKYHNLFATPFIGYNLYDGLMPGLAIHNYTWPATKFQFLAAGMYGFGSKKLNGIGRVSYTWYPTGPFRKIDLFLSGAHFSMNRYTDSTGKAWFMTMSKLTPGIRMEWKNPDARSPLYRYLQYKLYHITEDNLHVLRDTILNKDQVSLLKSTTWIHQFTAVWENMRKLYPYKGELRAEFMKDFARVSFTGHYFFNFRKKGGVDLRVFAGKFFYLSTNSTSSALIADRYQLNMTGPKGAEDYTYSDYFFGRNAYEGINNQQIMERDGFFKVRTDLLGAKVGKTDDWLAAVNLVMDVPDRLNPLAALPIRIPLKLFADLGTQAGAWGKNADGQRMLFDGGFAITLMHDRFRIYVPLVYGSSYGDYFKSYPDNKFFQRVSFSLDLREDQIRKWFRQGFE